MMDLDFVGSKIIYRLFWAMMHWILQKFIANSYFVKKTKFQLLSLFHTCIYVGKKLNYFTLALLIMIIQEQLSHSLLPTSLFTTSRNTCHDLISSNLEKRKRHIPSFGLKFRNSCTLQDGHESYKMGMNPDRKWVVLPYLLQRSNVQNWHALRFDIYCQMGATAILHNGKISAFCRQGYATLACWLAGDVCKPGK